MFTKAFHLSDIHIKGKRRDEYYQVFKRLFCEIKKEGEDGAITVVCGDIFQHKTKLTSTDINDFCYLMRELARLTPVVLIPGKHDKEEGEDLISPILKEVQIPQLYYYSEAGVYKQQNITFVHFNGDPIATPKDASASSNGRYLIGITHGEPNVSDFSDYDFLFCGGAHDYFVDNSRGKPKVAWSGALIQQNSMETLEKGFLVWNLREGSAKFVDLENECGFLKLSIIDGVLVPPRRIPKKVLDVVAEYENTEEGVVDLIITDFEERFGVKIHRKVDKGALNLMGIHPREEFNKLGDQAQHKELIELFLKKKLKDKLSDEAREAIITLHEKYVEDMSGYNPVITRRWRLKKMYWSGFFCYGSGNFIDFESFGGKIVGVIAPNRSGKSAVIDILLFALFDKCLRGDKKTLKNLRCKDYKIKLELESSGKEYIIEKWSAGEANHVSLSCGDRVLTREEALREISGLVGDWAEFLRTIIVSQNDIWSVVSLEPKQRIELLQKVFGLDLLENACAYAKEDLKLARAKLSVLEKPGASFEAYLEMKKKAEVNVKNICESIESVDKEIDEIGLKRDRLLLKLKMDLGSNAEAILSKISSLERSLKEIEKEIARAPKVKTPKETLRRIAGNCLDGVDRATLLGKIRRTREELAQLGEDENLEVPDLAKKERLEKAIADLRSQLLPVSPVDFECDPTEASAEQLERACADLMKKINRARESTKGATFEAKKKELEELKGQVVHFEKPAVDNLLPLIGFNDNCVVCKKNKNNVEKYQEGLAEVIKGQKDQEEKARVNNKLLDRKIRNAESALDTLGKLPLWEAELIQKRTQIKQLNEWETLDKNYAHNQEIERKIFPLQKELDSILKVYNYAINRVGNISRYHALRTELKNLQKALEALDAKEALEKAEIRDRLISTREDILRKLAEMEQRYGATNENNRIKEEVAKLSDRLKDLKYEEKSLGNRLACLRVELAETSKKMEEAKSYVERGQVLEKEVEILKLYVEMLNREKGIPVILLKEKVGLVEAGINNILSSITDFKVKVSGENIYIDNGVPVEMGSGFQRFIVGIAWRVCLADFSLKPLGNFMFIDEGFGCLDQDNLERVQGLLSYLKKSFGFLFVITHLEDMQNNLEKVIKIGQEGGFSRINTSDEGALLNFAGEFAKVAPVETKADSCFVKQDNGKWLCNVCGVEIGGASKKGHLNTIKHKSNLEKN